MKRPGDDTPEPPGGRAAERLRMFEKARQPPGAPECTAVPDEPLVKSPASSTPKASGAAAKKRVGPKKRSRHAKQSRRKK
jgi:hypothetical protein